jgi:hypothetical protein
VGLAGVVACSAADEPKKGSSLEACDKDEEDCTTSKKKKTTAPPETEDQPKQATTNVPEASVPLPTPDAGVDSSTTTQPQPSTTYCRDLNSCCLTLGTFEKFACIAVSVAGKETICQVELALCSGGGIGGTPCQNLAKCCDQMDADGYGLDADDCRANGAGNNAQNCSSWLTTYQNRGWCN